MPDDDPIQKTLQDPEFLKLGPDDQVSVLKHLRENGPAATQATATTSDQPNSILGGFGRRAGQTVQGLYETFKPPATPTEKVIGDTTIGGIAGVPLYRMGKGIGEAYQQKATDLATNIATKQYGKAALNFAQLAPGSPIGPASPTGSLVDTAAEGRYREAIGGAAFDALTTLLGFKMSKPLSTEARVGKLTAAVGKTGETAATLQKVLPDLDNVVKQVGAKPETLGDLRHATQTAIDNHEAPFNQGLAGIKNQLVDTSKIRQRILNLAKADSSPEELATIKKAADEYLQPKTMEWLDARRGRLNSSTAPTWDKSSRALATQVKSDLDMAIDRAARNEVANLEYDVMDRTYPGQNFGQSKSQVGALWKLKDQLDDQIGKLTDEQYYKKGKGTIGALKPSAYASKAGIHGYIGGVADIFSQGPLAEAGSYVNKAFGGSRASRTATAVAALGAPLERLSAQPKRNGDMNPPPQP